jgi:hypothetical protein
MLAALWVPVALHACFANGRITKSGTWPIGTDGYHHINVRAGTQNSYILSAINDAVAGWNSLASQTKVKFDLVDGLAGYSGTDDLVFHHGDTTQQRYGQSDNCAFQAEDANNNSAPAEIWLQDGSNFQANSGAVSIVDAATSWYGTSDWDKVVRLIQHEMGHFLLLGNNEGSPS